MNDTIDLQAWTTSRDEAAFDRIVKRHAALVAAACRRQLGDGDEADEATQATFLLLARRADKVVKPDRLGSWLYAVAIGVCRNLRRSQARRLHHEQKAAMTAQQIGTPDPLWTSMRSHLDEAIASLSLAHRELVIGHFLEGMPQSAIADRLRIKEDAAHKRIHQALDALRGWYARRGLLIGAGVLAAGLATECQAVEPTLITACTTTAVHHAPAAVAKLLATAGSSVGATVSVKVAAAAAIAAVACVVAPVAIAHAHRHEPIPSKSTSQAIVAPPTQSAIMAFDFEDGRVPELLHLGDVVAGPARDGNRFCVSAPEIPHKGNFKRQIEFQRPQDYLGTFESGIRVSFDCYLVSPADGIWVGGWNSTQKNDAETFIQGIPQGRWTHVISTMDDWRVQPDPSLGFHSGDLIGQISMGIESDHQAVLFIDNFEVLRP